MKKCACCGTETKLETCPSCGNASWLAVVVEEKKPVEIEVPAHKRGRR